MKFAHIADVHLDAPFTVLSQKKDLGDLRRIEQRNVLKKAIEYIKQKNIEYLFLAGDIYEHEYIRKTTIEYLNNLFKEIPNTKVFITPGNHDPYLKNSYYATYSWNNNVKIFNGDLEKYEDSDVVIYGNGFNSFTHDGIKLDDLQLDNSKINVLITHGSLDASSTLELQYNPIKSSILKQKGFDYVALGHIHKTNYTDGGNIIYPGSAVSMGFDELGEHGMIVGNLEKNSLNIEFVKLDEREFVEKTIDITNMNSNEELIQELNNQNLNSSFLYKYILIGQRTFEIQVQDILKLIQLDNVIKIKNETRLGIDINELAKEESLRGLFVRLMLEKINNNEYEKKDIEKAIEIGLDALNKL